MHDIFNLNKTDYARYFVAVCLRAKFYFFQGRNLLGTLVTGFDNYFAAIFVPLLYLCDMNLSKLVLLLLFFVNYMYFVRMSAIASL